MHARLSILLLGVALLTSVSRAADNERTIVDVVVTNAVGTTDGDTITVNGITRTFTNAPMAPLLITATNTPAWAATNLYNQIATYRITNITGSVSIGRITNGIRLAALPGDPLVVTIGGGWGTVNTDTTAVATNAYPLRLPLAIHRSDIRETHANDLVAALQYATTPFPGTAPPFDGFMNLTEEQEASNKTFHATAILSGMISNVVAHLTGAYLSNALATNSTFGGGTITGDASLHRVVIHEVSPGIYLAGSLPATNRITAGESGWPELRTYSGGTATNTAAIPPDILNYASLLLYFPNMTGTRTNTWSTTNRISGGLWMFGPNTLIASNPVFYSAILSNSVHIGPFQSYSNFSTSLELAVGAHAAADFAVVAGADAFVGTDGGVAIGHDTLVTSGAGVAIGEFSISTNLNSVAISGRTTKDFQIVLGSTLYTVTIPGALEVQTIRSTTLTGSITNSADWADPATVISTIADGNNVALASTNVYMRFTGTPTAAWTLNGVTGGRNGRVIELENVTGFTMTLAHNSGVDPVPGNRIYSPTLADVTIPNLGWAFLRYDSALARWKIRATTPAMTTITNVALTTLTDVVPAFDGLADGHLLTYDAAMGVWTNKPPAGAILWDPDGGVIEFDP